VKDADVGEDVVAVNAVSTTVSASEGTCADVALAAAAGAAAAVVLAAAGAGRARPAGPLFAGAAAAAAGAAAGTEAAAGAAAVVAGSAAAGFASTGSGLASAALGASAAGACAGAAWGCLLRIFSAMVTPGVAPHLLAGADMGAGSGSVVVGKKRDPEGKGFRTNAHSPASGARRFVGVGTGDSCSKVAGSGCAIACEAKVSRKRKGFARFA
jgi:hypothetical protein